MRVWYKEKAVREVFTGEGNVELKSKGSEWRNLSEYFFK